MIPGWNHTTTPIGLLGRGMILSTILITTTTDITVIIRTTLATTIIIIIGIPIITMAAIRMSFTQIAPIARVNPGTGVQEPTGRMTTMAGRVQAVQ